jgi:transcriptional regulator with XRE-family HTH domain
MEQQSQDLSPDAAERILAADFKNIVRKVKEGKTLTQTELARVQSRAAVARDASLTVARNVTELASVLGVARQTINRWRKIEGAPQPKPNGTHSVVEWRQFMAAHDLEGNAVSSDIEALKARKLLADIEDRELRTAVRKGEYVPLERVRQEWTTHIGKARALLEARFLNELPPVLVGRDAVSIREELERVLLECYGILHSGGVTTP